MSENVFQSFPTLETERLWLRETWIEDAPAIYDVLSRPEVVQYYNIRPLTLVTEAEEIVARRAVAFAEGTRIRWSIAFKETNGVIGSCGYVNWNKQASRAEIGYELSPRYWKQGLMREALTAIIDFGFSRMNLHRIEAFVVPENAASIKLLNKLGAQFEGTLREHGYWDDLWHDLHAFGLLQKDWESTS